MSKDLITGEIAVAIHLLEPTIIVSTCVVAALYWRVCGAPVAANLDSRLLLLVIIMGSCCFVAANCYDDGVAVGIFTATRCHHHGMVIKNIIQIFVRMLYLVFYKLLISEFN